MNLHLWDSNTLNMIDFSNVEPAGKAKTIAVPTRGDQVDSHFGHCEFYTIVYISAKNEVLRKEILESPVGCGCKSNIAATLKEKNVSVMLAGNMGQGAVDKLSAAGIQVIRGCRGNVGTVVNDYLSGEIKDNGLTCSHHDHGHECSHE
jgi:predicted Fe-Mo cluster-binding NifX family protein